MAVEIISWPNVYERHVAGSRIEPTTSWIPVASDCTRGVLLLLWVCYNCCCSIVLFFVVLSLRAVAMLCFINVAFPQSLFIYEPRHDKTNKMSVRPAKTQISLSIRPVWSESSLSAWRKLGSLATHWAHSKDSDQTGHPLWSDWADAQADLSLRWAHSHFVGFVMSRLIYWTIKILIAGVWSLLPLYYLGFHIDIKEKFEVLWWHKPFLKENRS